MPVPAVRRRRLTKSAYTWLLGATTALVLSTGLLTVSALGAGATPSCATSSLRLDLVPPIQGATSHRYWDMTLRNVGSTTCHLRGFPGVGLLDSHARPINDNVNRQTGFPQRNVVLRPWQPAWFTFGYVIAGPCLPHSFSAYGIEVFPPNSTSRLVYYRGRFDVCGPSLSHPVVYPVRPSRKL
jgi:hypothetical protein